MVKKISIDISILNYFWNPCFIILESGKILELNEAALKTFKIGRGELINTNFFILIEEGARNEIQYFLHNYKKDALNNRLETRLSYDNTTADAELLVSALKDEKTQAVDKYLVIVHNISEEKNKNIELLRFYNVVERSIFPIQITDLKGNMIYVNQAFIDTSGYKKEELIGKNPSVFGSGKGSKQFWQNMWSTITSGKVWVGEVEDRKKNGEPFYTQLMISPILDNDKNIIGYFAIHRDLSDKKLLEKQLIHSQKMESIGTLAAGIAHEVGNPLASISALVQVILRTTKDTLLAERLELIKHQVNRISKIIRDLVNFSRPSNYELKLTDINQTLQETINITKVGKKARNVVFKTRLSDKIPSIPLIPDQIEQVFLNILINAVDALNEKDEDGKKIEVETNVGGEFITVKISDNGTGIKEENVGKIFEPFFTTKKEGRGTGLGLWISYGIVKSFEGDIEIDSTDGKGTTFLIKLPVRVSHE
jgi:PAS domain S-box-containing protein